MDVNSLYEMIANELPVGIWRADENGKITFINNKIKEYFSECKIGQHFSELIEDVQNKKMVLNHWKETETLNLEFHKNKNGNIAWYRFTQYRVDGQYIGTVSNITSEKILLPALIHFREELRHESIFDLKN